MIVDYTVITETLYDADRDFLKSLDQLKTRVHSAMDKGWQPQGGITITSYGYSAANHKLLLAQTMIMHGK